MNVSNLRKSQNGELLDISGNKIFTNGVFNSLMAYDHLSQTTPAIQYVDAQIGQAFVPFSDDARKYIDLNVSKLLDDNASLANNDTNVKNKYLDDVTSFAALVNRICDNQNISNKIVGGTFTTKNDDSKDSEIPMYLCLEILKSKCLNYLERKTISLENFNLAAPEASKTSTLAGEFDKTINKCKTLQYDKEYFSTDINEATGKWLAACQVDASGSVDLYAKCDSDKCLVFVTQKIMDNGKESLNEKSSPLINVVKKAVVPNVTQPVTVTNITQPVALANNTQVNTNLNPQVETAQVQLPNGNSNENVIGNVSMSSKPAIAVTTTNNASSVYSGWDEKKTKIAGYRSEVIEINNKLKELKKQEALLEEQLGKALDNIINESSIADENKIENVSYKSMAA